MEIIDEEIVWNKIKTIVSKTDCSGNILCVNDIFSETSGYSVTELIGKPHNIIRHPDMPKVIFKKLWSSLKAQENFHAVIKNKSRSGRYYWVITDFTMNKDEDGSLLGYTGRRKAISVSVLSSIKPFYEKLLELEHSEGIVASEDYFDLIFKESNTTYQEHILDLVANDLMKFQELLHISSSSGVTFRNKLKGKEDYLKEFFTKS